MNRTYITTAIRCVTYTSDHCPTHVVKTACSAVNECLPSGLFTSLPGFESQTGNVKKDACDSVLGSGFHRVLRYPPPLTTIKSRFSLHMTEKGWLSNFRDTAWNVIPSNVEWS